MMWTPPNSLAKLKKEYILIGWLICIFFMVGALYGPYAFYHKDAVFLHGQNFFIDPVFSGSDFKKICGKKLLKKK